MKRTLLAAFAAVFLCSSFIGLPIVVTATRALAQGSEILAQYSTPGRDSRREELLGQREVDFKADRDVIDVGRNEGRFQKLRVVVRGAPIKLRDMKVVFADDSVFDAVSGDRIMREDSAYVFDLPGHRRVIKRITFLYRSVDRREGKATVLVYGTH